MNNKFEANPFLKIKQNLEPSQLQTECPRCQLTAITKILLINIPLFRQVMLCSFYCQHCGQRNSQVQFAGRLPDFGVQILFRCLTPDDLNREVVRSEHCTIWIQQLDLQIPAKKAQITTIQSILLKTHQDLTFDQNQRKAENQEQHNNIQTFLNKLKIYCEGKHFPITIKLRDPSGNSYIKNPFAPRVDKNMEIDYFKRTLQELKHMGYSIENAQEELRIQKQREIQVTGNKLNFCQPFEEDDLMKHEPVGFQVPCDACLMPGQMKTCRISVPFFSDIVIMSFTCQNCGHHTTQTKNSGQIGQNALIITLNVQNQEDLKRDLFKSQTCFVNIPDVELQLDYGTLGGVLTTVEGLLEKIHDHLNHHNPFVDSDHEFGQKMGILFDTLMEMRDGKRKFTLILIDPLARSFLQNPYHPAEDRNARRELRERTFEQNELLGLNDIKVQNYN